MHHTIKAVVKLVASTQSIDYLSLLGASKNYPAFDVRLNLQAVSSLAGFAASTLNRRSLPEVSGILIPELKAIVFVA
jgi:hypothetical protein